MRTLTIVLATLIGLAATALAQSEMLIPAQAADVLADLITATNAKADARIQALNQYIGQIGKDQAFYQFKAPPAQKPLVFFNQIYKGAILFVKNGGAQYADPALVSMDHDQLTTELTELQVYNIQQFQELMKKKATVDAMQAFLKSTGDLDKYRAWAKEHAPAAAAASPGLNSNSPEQIAAHMDEMIQSAKATAWKKAEARGMSQADFEQAWKQRVDKYREAIAKKVDGSKKLAESLTAAPPPAPTPPQPTTPIIIRSDPTVAPPLPPPGQSPYTPEMFQARDNELWNRFDD